MDNYEDMAGIFKKKMGEMKPSDGESEMPEQDDTTGEEPKLSASEQKLLDKVKAACSSEAFKEALRSILE